MGVGCGGVVKITKTELLVTPFVLALTPAVPITEEYKRAAAVPVASVETIIVIRLFEKCAATPETMNSTEMPGFVICLPFRSYSFAVIVEGVRLSAGTDGEEAVNTILTVGPPVKLT